MPHLVSRRKTAYDKHMTHVHRGFSIIEIIIVVVLIGILLALAVARLSSTQVSARDDAIKKDAETIARGLEAYYRSGNPTYTIAAGKYPSTDEFRHASGENITAVGTQVNGGYLDTWLQGVRLPSASKLQLITTSGQTPEDATNISNSTPVGVITYEPLLYSTAGGGSFVFCTTKAQLCNRFNLYYRTEIDNVVHTIGSEHQ